MTAVLRIIAHNMENTFSDSEISLATGVDTTYEEAPTATTWLDLENAPEDTFTDGKIGTITVSVGQDTTP